MHSARISSPSFFSSNADILAVGLFPKSLPCVLFPSGKVSLL
uniref:Uncharacterized protein n=1 Tax=Anguilla anguilla TaxID=7936 RepID=A0A0E9UJC4_ANGAN